MKKTRQKSHRPIPFPRQDDIPEFHFPPSEQTTPQAQVKPKLFDEQFQELEPIFAKLEQYPTPHERYYADLPFQVFDREEVKGIIRHYFRLGKDKTEQVRKGPSPADLEQKAHKIIAFMREENPPDFVYLALREWVDDIYHTNLFIPKARAHRVSCLQRRYYCPHILFLGVPFSTGSPQQAIRHLRVHQKNSHPLHYPGLYRVWQCPSPDKALEMGTGMGRL